jgi:hypothetical protein
MYTADNKFKAAPQYDNTVVRVVRYVIVISKSPYLFLYQGRLFGSSVTPENNYHKRKTSKSSNPNYGISVTTRRRLPLRGRCSRR